MCGSGLEFEINDVDDEDDTEEYKGIEVERKGKEVDKAIIKKLLDPRKPSEQEVENHELYHVPYRNWCAVCVRSKGKDLDHRKSMEEERGASEYSFDYCFPGDEFGYKLTVLVGKEKITGSVFASAVPTKGSSGMFIVDKAVEFVEETGDSNNTILLKTDQETSIKYFVKDFIEARVEGKTIPEESPVGSSGSNGRVERGVQSIEGQLRALLLAFEGRIGRRLDVQEKIVMFMPEYAAYLINRLEVGKDGKTSYERTKGKKATLLGIEFGEKLLYKVKKDAKLAKAREDGSTRSSSA